MATKRITDLKTGETTVVELTPEEETQRAIDAAKPPPPYNPTAEEIMLELMGKTQADLDAAKAAIIARNA